MDNQITISEHALRMIVSIAFNKGVLAHSEIPDKSDMSGMIKFLQDKSQESVNQAIELINQHKST
jgi:ferritin